MARAKLRELLDGKWEDGTRPKDLFAAFVAKDPAVYAADLIAGLEGDKAKVRNGCAELASLLSETHPELLFPKLALFQSNLGAQEPVLRWEAVCTIGNLVAADAKGATRASLEPITRFLQDKSIVLQGHAVRALAKMARAFPELAPGILKSLVSAADRFPGTRVGFVVEAMAAFTADDRLRKAAERFAAPYADSELKPVATKARKALKALRAR
jgi:hypothetical protein